MPWAGYARDIAPRLTAWSKTATVYSRAYSLSSSTSKSVPGMLSGRYPSELTRTGVFFTRYADENRFFCEQLGEASIPCVAAHAHAYLGKGVAGFDQGFSVWKLVPGITFDPQTDPHITSQKLTPLAIEMLSDKKLTDKPFFAWFHFMDPHDQYKRHEDGPKFGGKPRDLYDEEVHFADEWVGKLLDFIEKQPWASKTALILTADHGEAFGEHGLTRHAFEVYDVLVRVPWMIKMPGAKPRVIDVARSHIDLAPTVVDLLGQPVDKALPGKSLKPELLGALPEARDVICDLPQDDFNKRRRALIHENLKLIAFENDQRFELYRLDDDPSETRNLAKSDPAALKAMVARYEAASSTLTCGKVLGGIRKKD